MRGVAVNGESLLATRLRAGLTQEQLAMHAGLDVKTIRKAERNKAKFDLRTVLRLAKALGCSASQIAWTMDGTRDPESINQDVVLRWHETFVAADLDAHLMLYTEDTILEIPAAHGLPAAGNFQGIESLRQHLLEVFQLFRIVEVRHDDFQIHSAGAVVFLRTTATIEYRPTSRSYTARHYNEFELRDGLISRRVVIADYDELRRAMEP